MTWLIIDGYSLLHGDDSLASVRQHDWALARQRLVRKLEGVVDTMAARTTVVFDGRKQGPGEEFTASPIDVLFSPQNLTADTVIERMVCGHANPNDLLVVTSDRGERETVMAAGAQSMSCGQFLEWCRERRETSRPSPTPDKPGGPTLGDFFPDS